MEYEVFALLIHPPYQAITNRPTDAQSRWLDSAEYDRYVRTIALELMLSCRTGSKKRPQSITSGLKQITLKDLSLR